MLVIVSFGLVLLATILLIVGLLNDTVGLIVGSIVASVGAAVVLLVASRMARPKTDKGQKAPEPLPVEGEDDVDDVALDADDTIDGGDDEVAVDPEPTTPVAAAVAPVADADFAPDVDDAVDDADDEWMADEDWTEDDAVVDFPIADYDILTVGEIMPLLPQLYSDELDMVIEREQSGRNRSSIIRRLEELKVSGTDADREDTAAAPAPAASAPAPSAAPASDDDALFPIADYGTLTVGQIVPLLGQLEDDELEDVRQRELDGAGRKTVLAEIDRLLADDEPEAPAPAAPRAAATSAFPIDGYADLTISEIRPRLLGLSPAELQAVREREVAGDNRVTLLREIDGRLEDRGVTVESAPAPAPSRKASSSARFPIANYDDLTVADIRPRLTKLSDRQLEQVREREAAGAGRKTILKDIDARLS